ncbi:hypothetical protein DEO72_LG11g1457 [Vigna unguiculata]|uniref:Secreted protein n=1 Tax=Vigna unguiculata TaxID=3917 RepID=A0A4D6NRN9_VIGUN|nr:hypothetical protein DEO72_LG11g1457 [Vigna unguiculata]
MPWWCGEMDENEGGSRWWCSLLVFAAVAVAVQTVEARSCVVATRCCRGCGGRQRDGVIVMQWWPTR